MRLGTSHTTGRAVFLVRRLPPPLPKELRAAMQMPQFPVRRDALLPNNKHDSEASFVSHHPSVSFRSFCKRNGFDHRTDSLQGAEGKRVLRIYRRAGHYSCNRTRAEKQRNRIYLDWFISSGSGDNELAPKAFGAGRVEQVIREAPFCASFLEPLWLPRSSGRLV